MSDSVSAELEALSSKRASLKDKLKRRREQMGNILSGVTAATAKQAKNENEDKTKQDKEVRRTFNKAMTEL